MERGLRIDLQAMLEKKAVMSRKRGRTGTTQRDGMGREEGGGFRKGNTWRFLKKLEIELPYDPAIPLLGIQTEETRRERDTCTLMFITALFIIARTWKQPRCPSADQREGQSGAEASQAPVTRPTRGSLRSSSCLGRLLRLLL